MLAQVVLSEIRVREAPRRVKDGNPAKRFPSVFGTRGFKNDAVCFSAARTYSFYWARSKLAVRRKKCVVQLVASAAAAEVVHVCCRMLERQLHYNHVAMHAQPVTGDKFRASLAGLCFSFTCSAAPKTEQLAESYSASRMIDDWQRESRGLVESRWG